MDVLKPWVVKHELSSQRREGLFILLLSCGFTFYEGVLNHNWDVQDWPFLMYRQVLGGNKIGGEEVIVARELIDPWGRGLQYVTYEELVDALLEYKQQTLKGLSQENPC